MVADAAKILRDVVMRFMCAPPGASAPLIGRCRTGISSHPALGRRSPRGSAPAFGH
jgi:hypothetical protein